MAAGRTDPRWIYLLVCIVMVTALLLPVKQPITPEDAVVRVYDFIEGMPENSVVLLACDYDPQAKAELEPITRALLHHCFKRNLRVVGMTFWYTGNALANRIFTEMARQFPDKEPGRNYAYLGFKPGGMAQVITGMGENMTRTFPQDYENRPTQTMSIFQNVRSLKEISYIIDLAAGGTFPGWIIYGGDKYGIPMAVGCTAVSGPDLFVRLDAGQINGLIAGLRGAADYEALLEEPGLGVSGMFAQSLVHAMVILFVVVGNILFFVRRRGKEEDAASS